MSMRTSPAPISGHARPFLWTPEARLRSPGSSGQGGSRRRRRTGPACAAVATPRRDAEPENSSRRVDSADSRSTLCQSEARDAPPRQKGAPPCDSWDTPWPTRPRRRPSRPAPSCTRRWASSWRRRSTAGVIVATGGIAPTSEGAKITPQGRRVHRRRRAVRRGEGAGRRLGAHGVPRPGRGHRVVQALRHRPGRGRGPGPPRHADLRGARRTSVVVESVACRPPIRPPAIEAVFRMEFPAVVATWPPFVGDIGLAEELAQDALVDALRQWPRTAPRAIPAPGSPPWASARRSTCFRRNRALAAEVRPARPRSWSRRCPRPLDDDIDSIRSPTRRSTTTASG